MTDDLYERYKEALRTGHVAVLRGQLEAALDAYVGAADIAPARALPHTSLGGVYMRLGRIEEALAEYAAAIARAPGDEGALLGQAEALTVVDRPEDAAAALDRVAEIQEAAGRLPEAADTLRRALELHEEPERMRRQRQLQREIRLSAGDHAAEQQLARALRIREEPTPPIVVPVAPPVAVEPAPAALFEAPSVTEPPSPEQPESAPLSVAGAFAAVPIEPEAESDLPSVAAQPDSAPSGDEGSAEDVEFDQLTALRLEALGLGESAAEPEAETEIAVPEVAGAAGETAESGGTTETVAAEPEPVPVMAETPEAEQPVSIEIAAPQPSADQLLASAEAAEAGGDDMGSRTLLLSAARAYGHEGRFDAGFDVAQRLVQRSPGDVDAHLVLVELYVSRSWDGLAAEKLLLLGRLADLDGDETTKLRLCAAASQAFPADDRLQELCS